MKRIRLAKYQGVYYREHSTRKVDGKPDRCFDITYKVGEKKVWEKVGWVSEKYNAFQASVVRAERIRAIRHGDELPQDKKVTFGLIWSKYSEWAKLHTKAFNREENRYLKHLKDKLDDMPVSSIDAQFLENLMNDLTRSGKAPATVKHILALVRTVINKGIKLGMYKGDNPVSSIKLPKLNNGRVRFLTKEEAYMLIEEVSKVSKQWGEIASLSLHTGMRAGEVFGLKFKDVNLEEGIIAILDPKSGEGRHAYVTEPVRKILENREGSPDDFIFTGRHGQIKEVSDTFKRVVDKLTLNQGIDDPRQKVSFHTLRHTFASWLALNGETLLTIKELMGHKTIAMTMRYAHLIPDQKRKAVQRLGG